MTQITSSSISAIILAAGKSTRMGTPKALVHFREKIFLRTVIDNLKSAGIAEIVTVLGHEAEQIIEKAGLGKSEYIVNGEYERGQFSSLQTGIQRIQDSAEGVLVALVDQPQIPYDIFKLVAQAFKVQNNEIIIPAYRGKRGHPPVFPASLFEQILKAGDDMNASHLIRHHADSVFEVAVDDERILWNLNSRKDLLHAQNISNLSALRRTRGRKA